MKHLLQFIEYQNITIHKFEQMLGFRGVIIRSIKLETNIGSNVITKIFETFPEINPAWLLTGKGEMLLTGDNMPSSNPIIAKANAVLDAQLVQKLEESNQILHENVALSKKIISQLETQLQDCEDQKKILAANQSIV